VLGILLLPLADRPYTAATAGEGQPAPPVGPAGGQRHGRGTVRLVEEHGAAALGEPALPTLAGGGLRCRCRRQDADPPGQRLAPCGCRPLSRLADAVRPLVAVADSKVVFEFVLFLSRADLLPSPPPLPLLLTACRTRFLRAVGAAGL